MVRAADHTMLQIEPLIVDEWPLHPRERVAQERSSPEVAKGANGGVARENTARVGD